jgi:hypothetical protein
MRSCLFLILMVAFTAGCAKKGDVKDYIPPDESAKQALTTALDGWKAGKAPDQLGATKPAVVGQDKQWRSGKKLTAYEIVGPAPSEDQNKRFTVKLTLDGGAPQETTFVIFGKDPLWVVSAESYQGMSGM